MSTLKVTDIQSNGTGFNDVVSFQNASGTENGTLCRAWVNFDGTTGSGVGFSDITIRGSFNVSSITDEGTGDYTVTFTNAMPDANYAVTQAYTPSSSATYVALVSTMATGSVRMGSYLNYTNGLPLDQSMVSVAVFR